jgi:hypothetical protein
MKHLPEKVTNTFNTLKVEKVESFIKKNSKKKTILKSVREGAEIAVENKAGLLNIYYTGHGVRGSGNWIAGELPPTFVDKEKKLEYQVSLEDVLREIEGTGYTA